MDGWVNKNVPCYNCKPPVRHVGCHAECEAYLKYQAENNKRNEIRNARKSASYNKHFM